MHARREHHRPGERTPPRARRRARAAAPNKPEHDEQPEPERGHVAERATRAPPHGQRRLHQRRHRPAPALCLTPPVNGAHRPRQKTGRAEPGLRESATARTGTRSRRCAACRARRGRCARCACGSLRRRSTLRVSSCTWRRMRALFCARLLAARRAARGSAAGPRPRGCAAARTRSRTAASPSGSSQTNGEVDSRTRATLAPTPIV